MHIVIIVQYLSSNVPISIMRDNTSSPSISPSRSLLTSLCRSLLTSVCRSVAHIGLSLSHSHLSIFSCSSSYWWILMCIGCRVDITRTYDTICTTRTTLDTNDGLLHPWIMCQIRCI